jgi:predicted transcriptional regulator
VSEHQVKVTYSSNPDFAKALDVLRRIVDAIAPEAVEPIAEGFMTWEQHGDAGVEEWLEERRLAGFADPADPRP